MLKGILYSSNPDRLDVIHACMIHEYQNEVSLRKIYEEHEINISLIDEKPDVILIDIQSLSKVILELCNISLNATSSIWLVAYDNCMDHQTELHLFKWVNQQNVSVDSRLMDNKAALPQSSQNNVAIKKIAVPTLEGFIFVDSDEIIRFEAKGTYTNIYTGNGRKLISSKNIGEYELQLFGMPFFRIHQSHLINLNKMQRYLKGRGGTVVMEDGTHIEVASRRRNDFIHLFDQNS